MILLSNDDGYSAKGLAALIEALRPIDDLLVVAPEGARSGNACAITMTAALTNRLIAQEPATDGQGSLTIYACSGTPVDCVKLAFNILIPRLGLPQPRLVIGGVNHGDNSSVNTFYSGTMGVAFEGVHQGVGGLGFSVCDHSASADFTPCLPIIRRVVERVLADPLPPRTALNVNFPKGGDYRGIRVCRLAHSRWIDEVQPMLHPATGQELYWLKGTPVELEPEATDTDRWALANGYVAITPQTYDVTDYGLMGREF